MARGNVDNSIETNRWWWNERYDWSNLGEEWNYNLGKAGKSAVNYLIRAYMISCSTRDYLEIGPGGGRWSEQLQPLADRLVLVDLSEKCIGLCKKRFAHCCNVEYFVNNGANLSFLPTDYINRVWSWDTFVHIEPHVIQTYLHHIRNVMRQGGTGVISHANVDEAFRERYGEKQNGRNHGWRSDVTKGSFAEMCEAAGLKVVSQFSRWGKDGEFSFANNDIVTVFTS